MTLSDDRGIPEATAAQAALGVLDAEDPNVLADGAGVDFVVGTRLATVAVLGGLPAEAALATAIHLATQQAACLESDGRCESVAVPLPRCRRNSE
jgi:hypothetical protein